MFEGRFVLSEAQLRLYRQIADCSPPKRSPATATEIAEATNAKWFAQFPALGISHHQVNWAARRGHILRHPGNPPRFSRFT